MLTYEFAKQWIDHYEILNDGSCMSFFFLCCPVLLFFCSFLFSSLLPAMRWKTKSLTYQLGVVIKDSGGALKLTRLKSVQVSDEENKTLYKQHLDEGTTPKFEWVVSQCTWSKCLNVKAVVGLGGEDKELLFCLSLRKPDMTDEQLLANGGPLLQLGPPPTVIFI